MMIRSNQRKGLSYENGPFFSKQRQWGMLLTSFWEILDRRESRGSASTGLRVFPNPPYNSSFRFPDPVPVNEAEMFEKMVRFRGFLSSSVRFHSQGVENSALKFGLTMMIDDQG